MSPEQQAEWHSLGITEEPPMTPEEQGEIKRQYLEVTE
jgi:hypothetical protein